MKYFFGCILISSWLCTILIHLQVGDLSLAADTLIATTRKLAKENGELKAKLDTLENCQLTYRRPHEKNTNNIQKKPRKVKSNTQ